jgi:hypothetical protein
MLSASEPCRLTSERERGSWASSTSASMTSLSWESSGSGPIAVGRLPTGICQVGDDTVKNGNEAVLSR